MEERVPQKIRPSAADARGAGFHRDRDDRRAGITQRLLGGPRLADVLKGRDNNLNLIRMVAATAVLVSHAYPIALGRDAVQPLEAQIGMPLGSVAVAVFFVVSGLLVSQSWERSDLRRYATSRVLRIFPGLAAVLALTVGVLGPLVTRLPVAKYATRFDTWTYVPNNLMLVTPQYELPGVFSTNRFGSVINGSLWTLEHEVACYLALAVFGVAGAFRWPRVFAAAAFSWILACAAIRGAGWIESPSRVWDFISLSPYFAVGMGAYLVRRFIPLNAALALVGAVLAMVALGTAVFPIVFAASLGYIVFALAFLPGGVIRHYNRLGDYSYGVFIYAFPMQQLAMHLLPNLTPVQNMAVAFPATLTLAVLSWHGVEKRALALRTR